MSWAREAAATGRALYKTWGAVGIRRRVTYEAQLRLGVPRRRENAWLKKLETADITFRDVRPVVVPKRDGIAPSPIRLYGALEVEPDFPDSWHVHPFTGYRRPLEHWSQLSEVDPSTGDIKDLWELGRLTWFGPMLQRVAGGDDGAAEEIWTHIESFVEHNPPFMGPQWMCGQESALRGIMVMFVAYALRDNAATTNNRLRLAGGLVAQSVGRVHPTIGYALSQRNNHAISEGVFLWTAAHLLRGLPEHDDLAGRAARALEEAIDDQFYEDGSYAQHSPTYQRLALQTLLWAAAVAEVVLAQPPRGLTKSIASSRRFLTALMDAQTGRLPNLGNNDGALLFAVSPTQIDDFRPTLGHAAARTGALVAGDDRAWFQENGWFSLPDPAWSEQVTQVPGIAHHIHRGPSSHAVLRAGPTRHRPAHADQLHVDIWIDGVNVASDPGTFRYTAPFPWQNPFAGEEVHNLPRVSGAPQATRRGRFMWTQWSEARVVASQKSGDLDVTFARLHLPRGVQVQRLVARRGDLYVVLDRATENAIVRWNLPAGTTLEFGNGMAHAMGQGWHGVLMCEEPPRALATDVGFPASGWRARTYGTREPTTSLEIRVTEAAPGAAAFGRRGDPLPTAFSWDLFDARSSAEFTRALHEIFAISWFRPTCGGFGEGGRGRGEGQRREPRTPDWAQR